MTDNEIMSAIEGYLTGRMYNYALMIDGAWGCGKTYFLQNTLIPKLKEMKVSDIEDHYKVTYVSLYGIKDASTIGDLVYSRIFAEATADRLKGRWKKAAQGGTMLAKSSFHWLLKKANADEIIDVKAFAQLFPQFKNRVIIFDDLERSNANINEVFGQINSFVEHSEAHVIVVANEAEIGGISDENHELQLMLALNKDIKVDVALNPLEQMKQAFAGQAKEPDWTPDYIERRRKEIFCNGEEYRRIKEKVIGQTIKYEPDLKKVFTELLINSNLESSLLTVCGEYIDKLVEYAMRDNHPNIRTFLFFLEKSQKIFKIIKKDYMPAHNAIILYCYRSSIRYMMGGEMPTWDSGEYGRQEFNGGFSIGDLLTGFKFVDDLITKNYIDEEVIIRTCAEYAHKFTIEGKLKSDPYMLMQDWYIQEDDVVQKWLQEIAENIKSGRYSTEIYPNILNYVVAFRSKNAFIIETKSIVEAMKEFIKNGSIDQICPFDREQYLLLNSDEKNEFDEVMKELKNLLSKRIELSDKSEIEKAIESSTLDNWGERILESTSADISISGHSFMYYLEPETLIENITKSDNKQLESFRRALHNLYSNNVFYKKMADDYLKLKEFKVKLEKLDIAEFGDVKRIVIGWMKQNLEEYFPRVEAEYQNMQNRKKVDSVEG